MTSHSSLSVLAILLVLGLPWYLVDARSVPFEAAIWDEWQNDFLGQKGLPGPREKLCQACTTAVQQLEIVLSDPDIVNESIAILEGTVCKQLPGEEQDQCKAAVEQYVPIILQEMVEEVTIQNICIDKTKLCPPDIIAPAHLKGPEDCYACRLVVKLLKKHLSNPKTQVKIKAYLTDKCALIVNSTVAVQCADAVNKFLPVVFANLDVILDDKKLCKEAGLCTKGLAHTLSYGVASV